MNLWHDLSPGPEPPHRIFVVVEIPKGSRNKYEYDCERGFIKLDRVLYSAMHYPGDYGFMPNTLYDDGDPLDVLVMTNHPSFPGCVIEARPIGLLQMRDKDQPDGKVLAVPATDPVFAGYHDIYQIPQHFLAEVAHFFQVYKDLERIGVETEGWQGAAMARREIMKTIHSYHLRLRPEDVPPGGDG